MAHGAGRRAQGSGRRAHGAGRMAQGSGRRAQGAGRMAQGAWRRAQGAGRMAQMLKIFSNEKYNTMNDFRYEQVDI